MSAFAVWHSVIGSSAPGPVAEMISAMRLHNGRFEWSMQFLKTANVGDGPRSCSSLQSA
jgi:hypothetical protein